MTTDDPCDEWPVYIKWEGARFDPRCHEIKALPEADGKCDDCGSYVWFGEGATTAHCYNDDCGRVVRR